MSSSNRVKIAFIEESTYGVTPGSGNFSTARFINEELSGTPETVESAQIREDRLSSGQVVTNLTVGGTLGFELAKEAAIDKFIESAMYSTFSTQSAVTVDMTLDASARTLTRASGDFTTSFSVGDIATLAGFSNALNNVQIIIVAVSALEITYVGPTGMANETGSGTSITRADKIGVGTTKKSFSMVKTFEDLTTKGVNYKGMIVSEMELNVAFGELVNGTFTFSGNNQIIADSAGELITNGRTINAPATTQTFNGSVDMPAVAASAVGTFGPAGIDIQSITLSINNNVTPQNVIGNAAPKDYSAGTCQVSVEISAYLSDAAWAILDKKSTQTPFQLAFYVKNSGGFYGFYLPAVQVSFPDPSSPGANQDVILTMSGTGKVGSNQEKSIYIFKG